MLKWYRKAAEQNFARAQNNLGVAYEDGIGVAKDQEEAVEWYRKATEQNDADAETQNSLGSRVYYGDGFQSIGVKQHSFIKKRLIRDSLARRLITAGIPDAPPRPLHVYDAAGNVIETHEHKGDFKEP